MGERLGVERQQDVPLTRCRHPFVAVTDHAHVVGDHGEGHYEMDPYNRRLLNQASADVLGAGILRVVKDPFGDATSGVDLVRLRRTLVVDLVELGRCLGQCDPERIFDLFHEVTSPSQLVGQPS